MGGNKNPESRKTNNKKPRSGSPNSRKPRGGSSTSKKPGNWSPNSKRNTEPAMKKKQTLQAILWFLLCILLIGCVIGVAKNLNEPVTPSTSQESTLEDNLEADELGGLSQEQETAESLEGKEETAPEKEQESSVVDEPPVVMLTPEEVALTGEGVDLSEIPAYTGDPFVVVNNNEPYFTEAEMSVVAYEYYSPLDELGRCGVCVASVGLDVMPTEDRGSIGSVKPTGWMNNKYPGVVDGSYIYNRCHLIGFQLTGENANKQNLITGTRYINVEGMLPFENMVADYVKETGNHVMYRITPVFEGDNLLASGVLMEAKSVEDDGEGILFNVYCYNVQPGIEMDYVTGDNWLEE